MRSLRLPIIPVNILVLAIGLLDLISTVYWLQTGQVIEVNPIMAAVLESGLPLFIGIKLTTLAAYVLVMEWYRRTRDLQFAQTVGKVTCLAYLGIYGVSFWAVNHQYFFG